MVAVNCMFRAQKLKMSIEKKRLVLCHNAYNANILASSFTQCISTMLVQTIDLGQRKAQLSGRVLSISLCI